MIEFTRDPEPRKTYISGDNIIRKSFARLIQEGITIGEFRRDINFEEITTIIFALIDGPVAHQAINTTFSFKDDLPMFLDAMTKLLK